MSTFLLVRYNNPTNPFLSGADPFVDVATSAGSGNVGWISSHDAGANEFEIDAGVTEVEVTLRFTRPRSSREYVWIFRDRYRRQGASWAPVRAAPRALPTDPPRSTRRRVLLSSLERRALWRTVANPDDGARQTQATIPVVDVDLSLIDVTELVVDDHHGRRDHLDGTMMSGCALRFYQYTGTGGGERCTVVAALVAPPLRQGAARERVDTLTFFGPIHDGDGYSDAGNVYLGQLGRYLKLYAHTAESARFFGLCQYPHGLYQDAARTHQSVPTIAGYPECRFAYQLAQSGRAAVLLMPVANHGEYGPWSSDALTTTSGQRVDALLHSLLAALQSDGHLAGGATAPRVRRGAVGIAGFSAGGAVALSAFGHNRSNVTDLFLFDPNSFSDGGANQAAVLSWVQAVGRRLRLIGGLHRRELVAFARRAIHAISGQSEASAVDDRHDRRPDPLSANPNVLVLPTRDAFWSDSPDYSAAHATAHDPLLTEEGASPVGLMSGATGIFVVPGTGRGGRDLELRGELPGGGRTTATNVSPFTLPELALGIYAQWWLLQAHRAFEQQQESERQALALRHQHEVEALAQRTPGPTRREQDALQRRHRSEEDDLRRRHSQAERARFGAPGSHWPLWTQAHIQSQDDFDTRLHRLRTPIRRGGIAPPYGARHQWCVYGGQGAGASHDASFRGYLQICLETSSFAR